MATQRQAALAALIFGGLATNLGSNFVGPADNPEPAGVCRPGSIGVQGPPVTGLQGLAGAPLPAAVQVRVGCLDAATGDALPVGNQTPVTWRAATGSVNGAPVVTTNTGPQGQAEVLWTLGPAVGTQTLSVEVGTQLTTITAQASAPVASSGCASGGIQFTGPRRISGGETWTLAGSPYRGGNVEVLSGATLRVDPGVTICISELTVATGARLLVQGSPTQPVTMAVADPSRDSWTLLLQGAAGNPAAPASELKFLMATNLRQFAVRNHHLLLEDSRFVIDPALHTASSCAQLSLLQEGAQAPSRLLRSRFEGYGGLTAGCDSALRLETRSAPAAGPNQLQVRVLGSRGDGLFITAQQSGAPAWALSECEFSGSTRHGIAFGGATAALALPGATVSGCALTNNGGLGIASQLAAGQAIAAQRNWWGDPAGPEGPAGDGVSPGIDASLPLASPPILGH